MIPANISRPGRTLALLAFLASGYGCTEPSQPKTAPRTTESSEPTAARSPNGAVGTSTPAEQTPPPTPTISRSEPEQIPAPQITPAKLPTFPPPDFAPPFERTAAEGDGHWVQFGNADLGELAGSEPHLIYQSVVHPHPASRYHSLTVVAIDLDRVEVRFVPGNEDEGINRLPKEVTPGLVPESLQARLLAVFNGGFQARHGWWGVMSSGKTLVPPRDIGCTLALYRDDSVRLAPWTSLSNTAADMLAFRQTPPCLLDHGEVHSLLRTHQDRLWAGKNPNEITRRRSAVGLSEDGKVLFYGVGIELDAQLLAQAMRLVGATQAAELDINWNWTRFFLFGKTELEPDLQVTSTLLEGMAHGKHSYVAHAEARDFFYVLKRQ